MKILALADLHMGAGAAYADDRLHDQALVLAQIVEILAADEEIRLVLLAGDCFHRPRPTPATLLTFRKFVDCLAEMEIPTIAITGNAGHDIEAGDRPCALDLFSSRWFRVSRRPELITEFAGVNVATLPSVPVSRLVAQSESTERGPIFDQAAEALIAVAYELKAQADYYEPVLPSGAKPPTILMGHWSVSGASLPNGLPVDTLNEPILDLASLVRLGYDAGVFGHIHSPQPLGTLHSDDEYLSVFYCGSAACVDFGEAHVEHGCWTFDAKNIASTLHFHALKDRAFITVDADLTDPGNEDILDEIIGGDYYNLGPNIEGAVVRVKYRATEEQHRRVDTAALKKAILNAGAHKVFQISAEIIKTDRARVQGVDENLDPGAALALWCEANEIDDTNGLADLLARYSATTP